MFERKPSDHFFPGTEPVGRGIFDLPHNWHVHRKRHARRYAISVD